MTSPFRTANSAIAEDIAAPFAQSGMQLSALQSANAITAETPENGWYLVSPYGEFPEPGHSYTQVFYREQADEIVRSWNSIAGKAFRWIKNVRHKLKPTFSAPVFDASELGMHPDLDPSDWSQLNELARVQDLRCSNIGLEALIEWDPAGMSKRGPGPLKPSVNWWHNTPNADHKVFPAHFESITLTRFPNITSVPAWTPNSNNQNPMNENQLKALRKSLNLPDDCSAEKVIETAQSAYQLSTSNATALQTANSAKTELETKLATATAEVAATIAERKTANTAKEKAEADLKVAQTANGILTKGILDLFEKAGKFTPAERKDMEAKFTANVADSSTVIAELEKKTPVLNTKAIELNGNRVDISTANARKTVIDSEVAKLMNGEEKLDYNSAFTRVQADPKFAQIFAGMVDPTAKKAA